METTTKVHAAIVQYHRWYLERDFENKQTRKSVRNSSRWYKMKSAAGNTRQNELSKRLKVYKGWKNAHHIQNSS
jgi:hypothetical protein